MLHLLLPQYGHQEKNCRAQASDRSNSMQSGPTDQKHVSLGRSPVYTCLEQPFVRWKNHDECEGNDHENQRSAGDPEHRITFNSATGLRLAIIRTIPTCLEDGQVEPAEAVAFANNLYLDDLSVMDIESKGPG